jgi:hypothetical protein
LKSIFQEKREFEKSLLLQHVLLNAPLEKTRQVAEEVLRGKRLDVDCVKHALTKPLESMFRATKAVSHAEIPMNSASFTAGQLHFVPQHDLNHCEKSHPIHRSRSVSPSQLASSRSSFRSSTSLSASNGSRSSSSRAIVPVSSFSDSSQKSEGLIKTMNLLQPNAALSVRSFGSTAPSDLQSETDFMCSLRHLGPTKQKLMTDAVTSISKQAGKAKSL